MVNMGVPKHYAAKPSQQIYYSIVEQPMEK